MPQSLQSYYKGHFTRLSPEEKRKLIKIGLADERGADGKYVFHASKESHWQEIRESETLLECVRQCSDYLNDTREIRYVTDHQGEKVIRADEKAGRVRVIKGEEEPVTLRAWDGEVCHRNCQQTRAAFSLEAAAVREAMRGGRVTRVYLSDLTANPSGYGEALKAAVQARDTETKVTIRRRSRDGRVVTTYTTLTLIEAVGEESVKGRRSVILRTTEQLDRIIRGEGMLTGLRRTLTNLTHPLMGRLGAKARALLLLALDTGEEGWEGAPDELRRMLGQEDRYGKWSDYCKRLLREPAREIEERSGGGLRVEWQAFRSEGEGRERMPERVRVRRAAR